MSEDERVGGYTKKTGAQSDSEYDSSDEAVEDNSTGEKKTKEKKVKKKGKTQTSLKRKVGNKKVLASTKVRNTPDAA